MRKNHTGKNAAVEEHDDDVRGAQLADPEDAERHERARCDPALDEQERGEQEQAGSERSEHAQRAPAERRALHDPVDERTIGSR